MGPNDLQVLRLIIMPPSSLSILCYLTFSEAQILRCWWCAKIWKSIRNLPDVQFLFTFAKILDVKELLWEFILFRGFIQDVMIATDNPETNR